MNGPGMGNAADVAMLDMVDLSALDPGTRLAGIGNVRGCRFRTVSCRRPPALQLFPGRTRVR